MTKNFSPPTEQLTLASALSKSTVVSSDDANVQLSQSSSNQPHSTRSRNNSTFAKQKQNDQQDPKNIKDALLRLLPKDIYSLVYVLGVVVGTVHYIHTKDMALLATFLGVTSGQTILPEVKHLIPWIKTLPKTPR